MAAVKAAGNVTVTYNSNDITSYCDTTEIAVSIAELDTTNLASTAMTYIPGLADWTVSLNVSNWDSTIDGYLSPDVVAPGTLRTLVVAFDDGSSEATYTWTANAFITGLTIGGGAADKIGMSGLSIRCNGAPTRTVA